MQRLVKDKFVNYIKDNNLFSRKNRLLVAVSGGIDSIALIHLLYINSYKFDIAHCNFQLRGSDSDKDANFVEALAKKYNVSFYSKKFNVKSFSDEHKLSIQMAARDLRYQWLEETRRYINAKFILTGHHRDDDIETFFINLIRGTGIQGMLGIKKKYNKIIRPLLFSNREEIERYVNAEKIRFREDKSNKSNKYLRNKIRNQLTPIILSMNPSFPKTFIKERLILQQIYKVYRIKVAESLENIIRNHKTHITIDIKPLKELNPLNIYLYELLSPYGFSCVNDIEHALFGHSGKQFFSHTHCLTIDRERIIISAINNIKEVTYSIAQDCQKITEPIVLRFGINKLTSINENNKIAHFDYNKLIFPLTLRKWEIGDKFMPLGMHNYKKLSDFFIDEKISLIEKKEIWILCSGDDIIWVVGKRIDNRYKISQKTKKMYIATLL